MVRRPRPRPKKSKKCYLCKKEKLLVSKIEDAYGKWHWICKSCFRTVGDY